jgi:hypothetical protein
VDRENALDVAYMAEVLTSRKIICDEGGSVDPDEEPGPISFEEERSEFIKAASDLTGIDATHDNAEESLARFSRVIKDEYKKAATFKITLLRELRKSLGGFCVDTNADKSQAEGSRLAKRARRASPCGATLDVSQSAAIGDNDDYQVRLTEEIYSELASVPIMLKGSPVGFAADVNRNTSLKFPSEYGLCKDSKYGMACLVFRNDVCDATATVALKLSNAFGTPPTRSLDLKTAHVPMAQSLLNGTDVWHSLARRGYKADPQGPLSVSAVVLAARKAAKEGENREKYLCCMEAYLVIPNKLGGRFFYRINRWVTVRPESDDKRDDAKACPEALAVFIKTLRIGLTRAKALLEDKGAVSLCCSPPRDDLVLLASPIPLAAITQAEEAPDLTVTRGELYQFRDTTVNVEDWIKGLEKNNVLVFDGARASSVGSLVNVSCGSVHGALAPARDNWAALERIGLRGTGELKLALANVLLACAFVNGLCIVTVMKMVSHLDNSQRNSSVVCAPSVFDTPLLRWEAFKRLTISTLLPMADVGVVHNDIRYDPEKLCFCNIIADSKAEFRLIDFESLVILSNGSSDLPLQKYAISLRLLRFGSAHEFVLWQVLWVSYVWYPRKDSDVTLTAVKFVLRLLKQRHRGFGHWIEANSSNGLSTISGNLKRTTKEGVLKTLDIISEAFRSHQSRNQG